MSRFALVLHLLGLGFSRAFLVHRLPQSLLTISPVTINHASMVEGQFDQHSSFSLTEESIRPVLKFGSENKVKIVNAFGLWCAIVCVVTGSLWYSTMTILQMLYAINDTIDPHKAFYDNVGKVWSKAFLSLTNSYPTLSGDADALAADRGPCLYVANHASWLDIPLLCTILDPVFKFIAKSELVHVPCIGQQLAGGKHILLDRHDRRSQLRSFKEALEWLDKGVPIMAFPEGQRSHDGRLMEFKGGLFSMAIKANVPIVPISISHAHAIMPGEALFPVQPGNGILHLHVHDPIYPMNKSEKELGELVRQALLSHLPAVQHPVTEVAFEERKVLVAST